MKRIGRSVTVLSVFLAMILPAACLGVGGGGSGGGPKQCLPAVDNDEGPVETNPECEACVQRSCALDDDCGDMCESFYDCTCDCDPEDSACFSACDDEKTPSCSTCQEESSETFFACLQDSCAGACGLASAEDGFPGDDDGLPGDDGFPGGDDDGDDGSPGGDCAELAACCPMLTGVDRDLCEDADEPFECELWLDIFRDDGSC